MHQTLIVAQRLLSSARMLNLLITDTRAQLSMAELVILSELNEEFNKHMLEIDVNSRGIADDLHKFILSRGLEPRSGVERRSVERGDRRRH